MHLHLTEEEREVLTAAVSLHIQELMRELAATESREYQHDLAGTVTVLEGIAKKLTDAPGLQAANSG